MQLGLILAAAEGGVVDGLKATASEIGHKFGFNTSLFISQLIGFFVVAFVLQRFAFKPLQKILSERESKIAESLAAAERMKADLAKADEERKRVLSEAGLAANKIIEEARAASAWSDCRWDDRLPRRRWAAAAVADLRCLSAQRAPEDGLGLRSRDGPGIVASMVLALVTLPARIQCGTK